MSSSSVVFEILVLEVLVVVVVNRIVVEILVVEFVVNRVGFVDASCPDRFASSSVSSSSLEVGCRPGQRAPSALVCSSDLGVVSSRPPRSASPDFARRVVGTTSRPASPERGCSPGACTGTWPPWLSAGLSERPFSSIACCAGRACAGHRFRLTGRRGSRA